MSRRFVPLFITKAKGVSYGIFAQIRLLAHLSKIVIRIENISSPKSLSVGDK